MINKELRRARNKRYYEKNKEDCKARSVKNTKKCGYKHQKKYLKLNKDHKSVYTKTWKQNNPGLTFSYRAKHLALKKQACPK